MDQTDGGAATDLRWNHEIRQTVRDSMYLSPQTNYLLRLNTDKNTTEQAEVALMGILQPWISTNNEQFHLLFSLEEMMRGQYCWLVV